MEIVIKIPEKLYKQITVEKKYFLEDGENLCTAVANGIPLPKGHGNLIDENELLEITKSYKSELGRLKVDPFVKSGIETVERFIKEMSPIIEADKNEQNLRMKQESVLDKIRAEIMDFEEELFHRPNTDYADYAAVRHCVEIIDKYKAESEGKE